MFNRRKKDTVTSNNVATRPEYCSNLGYHYWGWAPTIDSRCFCGEKVMTVYRIRASQVKKYAVKARSEKASLKFSIKARNLKRAICAARLKAARAVSCPEHALGFDEEHTTWGIDIERESTCT